MGDILAKTYISVGREPHEIVCRLAGTSEIAGIAAWRRQTKNRDSDAIDALEFAKHSTKRWGFYKSSKRAMSSLTRAKARVKREPHAELAFMAVLTGEWAPKHILGFTLFRRSWCNHIAVDFIASHPANRENPARAVSGVLRATFRAITEVAFALRVTRIWGEATDSSAEKYAHIFDLKKSRGSVRH
jgi:hypothetical protein